jgi:hypothetical protein
MGADGNDLPDFPVASLFSHRQVQIELEPRRGVHHSKKGSGSEGVERAGVSRSSVTV